MITFNKRDRDYPGYTPTRKPVFKLVCKKPKGVYQADGYTFELYPVSILAESIDRTKKTVIMWEGQGKFPKPLFDVPDTHYTKEGATVRPRWYSNHQIMNIHKLWFIKYDAAKCMKDEVLDNFFEDVKKIYFKRDYVEIQK